MFGKRTATLLLAALIAASGPALARGGRHGGGGGHGWSRHGGGWDDRVFYPGHGYGNGCWRWWYGRWVWAC